MEQLRIVDTRAGTVYYRLTRKRVKNWNLRVRDGQVCLSVPLWVREGQADEFICSRGEWIVRALERQSGREPAVAPEQLPPDECLLRLTEAVERMLPLAARLGVKRPELRLRRMKSQWGNCHYRQGYITLNTVLAGCSQELQDYVALHELIHFVHPNHGAGFYAAMDALMPDWKRRRAELKNYRLQ